MARKNIVWVVISRILSVIVFLLLLFGLNLLAGAVKDATFDSIVSFLNDNVGVIVVITFIFLIADLIAVLPFPLDIPSPLINAVGAVAVAAFILRIMALIDRLLVLGIALDFAWLRYIIYPLVFLIALLVGYIAYFTRPLWKYHEDRRTQVKEEKATEPKRTVREHAPSWDDVGAEFRRMLYDRFHHARKKSK